MKALSHVRLWMVTYQAPPSMGFSRHVYWSWQPFPSPGDLPNQGLNPGLLHRRQTLYSVLSNCKQSGVSGCTVFRMANLGGSSRRREVWGERWNGRPSGNDLEKAILSYFPFIRILIQALNKDSWDCYKDSVSTEVWPPILPSDGHAKLTKVTQYFP